MLEIKYDPITHPERLGSLLLCAGNRIASETFRIRGFYSYTFPDEIEQQAGEGRLFMTSQRIASEWQSGQILELDMVGERTGIEVRVLDGYIYSFRGLTENEESSVLKAAQAFGYERIQNDFIPDQPNTPPKSEPA